MARTTTSGFKVWNLTTDTYNHQDLADNWDLLETLITRSGKNIQAVNNLTGGAANGPRNTVAQGDLAVTTTTVENFPSGTLIQYTGSDWKTVGPVEVVATLPTQHNYTGRVIFLTASVSNFIANSLLYYTGSTWDYASGFTKTYTGAASNNISAFTTTSDLYINSATRGPILVDRTTSTKYRLYINNGILNIETVS